jgi:predicted O-methyltransferase YrrM
MAFSELRELPAARQLLHRRDWAERYFSEVNKQYGTYYQPGCVNLDDALFLYWLIRQLQPRTVIETGVCNGFSAGLIALALAQNANDGRLHAVGRAEIFDEQDPRWREKGRARGEVVIGGKSLGWMIPDDYLRYVTLYRGDATVVLPDVVNDLESIDLFFHDSDHSYDHMMLEFREAKRKLSPVGTIVADNIAWNSSLWDLADEYAVPAYNFRGSVGVAFFG